MRVRATGSPRISFFFLILTYGVSCGCERTGDYEDALRNKKALVIPMILEAFGGISPHISLHFTHPAPRATGE